MKAENSGQVDNFLLSRIRQCLLVLVAQIDGDLLLGRLHARLLWRWNPFLAANDTRHEWLQVRYVWCLYSLLIDVLN